MSSLSEILIVSCPSSKVEVVEAVFLVGTE